MFFLFFPFAVPIQRQILVKSLSNKLDVSCYVLALNFHLLTHQRAEYNSRWPGSCLEKNFNKASPECF